MNAFEQQTIMSDEDMDFWGDLFVVGKVGERLGITFEQFLKEPRTHLARAGMEGADERMAQGFLPLLPKQQAVISRLHAKWDAEEHARRSKEEERRVEPCLHIVRVK